MEPSPDELAGIADCFGGLTRAELCSAVEDLAARAGEPFDRSTIEARIDGAVTDYYLVTVDHDAGQLLCPGPAALPVLPDGGEDIPHLLSIEPRTVDHSTLARTAEERLRGDAARAVNDGDTDRVEALLDICYDLETWGGTDTDAIRDQLAQHTE